jgi:hypothetical protein
VVRERRARLSELAAEVGAAYRASLAGTRDTVLLEGGFTGLSGRYQRVRIDPAALDSVPDGLVDVELEVGRDAEGVELRGRPLAAPVTPVGAGA